MSDNDSLLSGETPVEPQKEQQVNMDEPPQWTRQLPDKYKDDARFHKHGTFSSFIDHHVGLEESGGQRQKPESVDSYVAETNDLPEGMVRNEDLEGFMKNVSHEIGLNNDEYRKMYKKAYEFNQKQAGVIQESRRSQKESATATLKQEWGEAFGRNTELARRALAANDNSGEFHEMLRETGLDNDPRTIKFLQYIGERTSDDVSPPAGGSSAGSPTSKRYPGSPTMWSRQKIKAKQGLTG